MTPTLHHKIEIVCRVMKAAVYEKENREISVMLLIFGNTILKYFEGVM